MVTQPVRYSSPKLASGAPAAVPRTVSGGGGRSAPRKPTQTAAQRNKVFEDFRAGRISRTEAIGKISGTSARQEFEVKLAAEQRAQQESAQQAARQAAQRTQQALRNQGTSTDRTLSRNDRVEALILENRESGILTSRSAAERVIRAREQAERAAAERAARVEAGATGEVQAIEDRGIFETIESVTTRKATGRPTGIQRIGDVAGRVAEVEKVTEFKLFGERTEGAPTSEEQRKALKESFPPIRVFEFAAEGVVRGGEFLGGGPIPPEQRKITKQIIEDIFTISTFTPFIQTGTAQETVQTGKVKGKLSDKEKLKRLLELREELAKASVTEAKNYVNNQVNLILNNPNLSPAQKTKQVNDLVKFVSESRGLSQFGVSTTTPTITTGTDIIVEVPQVAQIPAVGETIFAVSEKSSFLDPSKVGQTNFVGGSGIFEDLKTDTKQKTGQLFDFGAAQDFAQDTAQDTTTIQDSLTATTLLTTPSLAQPQVNLFGEPTPQRGRRPGEPEPLIKIKPIKRDSAVKRIAKKITKGETGWIAEVLENKKWKKVNPNKPISKKRAEKLGKKVADRTIAASSRVTQSKKKAGDWFAGIKVDNKKFRDFKIKAGRKIPQKDLWIEKRKHRLDTKNEVQTLQAFKRSKEFSGLVGKPKRKAPKKKRAKRTSTNLFFR